MKRPLIRFTGSFGNDSDSEKRLAAESFVHGSGIGVSTDWLEGIHKSQPEAARETVAKWLKQEVGDDDSQRQHFVIWSTKSDASLRSLASALFKEIHMEDVGEQDIYAHLVRLRDYLRSNER